MTETILITGARGKTGRRLSTLLIAQGVPVRRTSRGGDEDGYVAFDWSKPETFASTFEGVTAAYLVAPTDRADHADLMIPGIDAALALGVRRFVLLSASSLEAGGPMMGAMHAYLQDTVQEWCVLRPTWFMQNFSEQQHLLTIKNEGAIYTASGHGRVPFINADDIAAAASGALTSKIAPNRDVILTGPETLSYDDVAARLSQCLGRTINHIGMSRADFIDRLLGQGFNDVYAAALADMDVMISEGGEDRLSDGVNELAGHVPKSFDAFVEENAEVWIT